MKKSKLESYEQLLKTKEKQYEQLETKYDLMQLTFTEEMLQMLQRKSKQIKSIKTASKKKLHHYLLQAQDSRFKELKVRYSALKTLTDEIVTLIHKTTTELKKLEEGNT